jgi:chemotaxis protein CheC
MLTQHQLNGLTILFRFGAADASVALSRWLGRPAMISSEQAEQLSLADAGAVLGFDADAEPIAACVMEVRGALTGMLIMAFDDASGFRLADLLLEQPIGTTRDWNELSRSAALETANIVGCAYLNALVRSLQAPATKAVILPSPPQFQRDFAQSIVEGALMNQAMTLDLMYLTRTTFRLEDEPLPWFLLFVPDAPCLPRLAGLLDHSSHIAAPSS